MGLLFCLKIKKRIKFLAWGDTTACLTMTISACKAATEKISLERGISEEEAMNIVVESIKESQYSLKRSK